jgi:hypothetical protein
LLQPLPDVEDNSPAEAFAVADPDPTTQRGDFQADPPPGPDADDRLQKDAPPPEPEGRLSFAGPGGIDIRKKLGPRGKLLLALFPVALAVGAWFLAGGVVWVLTALGAAGLLLLIAIRYLPSIDFLRLHQYLKFAYLVLCWCVWAGVGYFLPLSTVKVEAALGSGWEKEPDCPMRIVYGRQVDVELDRSQEYTIEFRGRFDPGSLKIYTLTPTGWLRRSVEDYSSSVRLNPIPLARLYVDNRKHGAVGVGCGQMRFPVAAGKHQRLRIAAPPASSRCPVTLDGKEVGTLAAEEDLLLDTLGTRSYRLRKIVYGGVLEMLAGQEPGLFPQVEVFRGGHVHKLGVAVDYFLEDAPKEIKVPSFGGLAVGKHTRYELTAIEP